MKRLVLAVFPALLIFGLLAMPASAGVQWCRTDPIIAVNGEEVNVWLSIPQQWEAAVNGPSAFTITLPSDVDREVVFMDEGLNGYGETVTFVNSAPAGDGEFTVSVFADVPLVIDPMPLMDVPMLLTIELPDGQTLNFEGSSQAGVSGSFQMESGAVEPR